MKQGTFACLILFCMLVVSAVAKENSRQDDAAKQPGISAGGNWLEFDKKDPITDAKRVRFEIEADNFLRNSGYYKPKIEIFCKDNGEFSAAQFDPNVKIGPPNRPGFWGQPQLEVRVRADDKHSNHGWNWINGKFLSMDKGSTRELVRAKVFKIEFPSLGGPEIANFSPAGLDIERFRQACGLKD
ncbi:MAG TPA: hypothetical protein VFA74_00080 [Terriglobales bacterium]|nr:hypothetical protein [Terriglobales bacterium]